MRRLAVPALALLLAGCSSPGLPRFLRGGSDAPATTGGTAPLAAADQERSGDALFARAAQLTDPAEKAPIYGDIAEDFPGHPRALEARYLQGRSYYEAGEWSSAIEALKEYMNDSPVNPHLAEVEEMLYQASLRYMARDRGLLDVFSDDSIGLEGLRYIPVVFPAGRYADDSILYLARHYRSENELQRASLYYKELLQRYPDSEWSFEARRELGATYAERDVGEVYHAGFVDRDPREAVPSDDPKAAAFAGPVKSGLEMALTEYDKYLERIAGDPGRRAEYAQRVAEVEAEKARVRARLAEKDERVAAWYASQGDARAAEVYRRSAARWRGASDPGVLPAVAPQPLPRTAAPTPGPRTAPPVPAPAVRAPAAIPQPPATTFSPYPTNLRVPPPPPPPAWPPAR